MFKLSFVTAFLLCGVCTLVNAEDKLRVADTQLPNLGVDSTELTLVPSQTPDAKALVEPDKNGAIDIPGMSATELDAGQENHEMNTAVTYVATGNATGSIGSDISGGLLVKILAIGLVFVGGMVLLFRYAASVVYR